MKTSFKLKAIAAALALAGTGSAFANTALNSTTTGSIVLNVFDATNGDSFVFDTGLTAGTIGSTTSYSASLSADANYQAFLSAVGSDELQYSVVGNQKTGAVGEAAYSTVASFGSALPSNSKVNAALTTGDGYYQSVNLVSSNTLNSAFENGGEPAATYGPFSTSWESNLQINELASVGSALNFYSFAVGSSGVRSSSQLATLTSFGTWNFSSGTLTYSAVPVPASWGLLLSGLALMGVIARRGKSSEGDFFTGAAA